MWCFPHSAHAGFIPITAVNKDLSQQRFGGPQSTTGWEEVRTNLAWEHMGKWTVTSSRSHSEEAPGRGGPGVVQGSLSLREAEAPPICPM